MRHRRSAVLLSALIDGDLGFTRARILVSLVVLVTGGSLVVVQHTFPEGRGLKRLSPYSGQRFRFWMHGAGFAQGVAV